MTVKLRQRVAKLEAARRSQSTMLKLNMSDLSDDEMEKLAFYFDALADGEDESAARMLEADPKLVTILSAPGRFEAA